MMMLFQLPLLIVIGCVAAAVDKIPDEFKRCHRSLGNEFDNCLNDAVEDALRRLETGIPQLGIYPIDPLEVSSMSIAQGSGPVSIQLRFDNIKMYGISQSKIFNHKADLTNYTLYLEAVTPQFRLEGDYILSGNVLLLPIHGKGRTNITLDQLPSVISQKLEPFMKDGKKYMKEKEFTFKMYPKTMTMYFGNLFNGDKTLGAGMNKFLNDNWQVVMKELKPSLEEALSKVFRNVANRFFVKVPLDEIYPK